MDIIEMTRELAKAIQADERYLRLEKAQKCVDEDNTLQEQISSFNEKRYQLSIEVAKENRDQKLVDDLNAEVRELYDSITGNAKMIDYNDAQDSFDTLYNFLTHILQMATNGVDPDTVDEDSMNSGCSGSCETCGGCH